MLNGMLTNSSYYPTFNDATYRRRLASAERLRGPQRYLELGRLATSLAREAAPLLPYGNGSGHEFFSRRIGCQTYGFYNRVDLAALCIKHQHDPN